MNVLQAKAELKELANGVYHSLYFEMGEHGSGDMSAGYKVYIHNKIYQNKRVVERPGQSVKGLDFVVNEVRKLSSQLHPAALMKFRLQERNNQI